MSLEKSPYFQIMIKWFSQLLKSSDMNEIRPFLTKITEIFRNVNSNKIMFLFTLFLAKKGKNIFSK